VTDLILKGVTAAEEQRKAHDLMAGAHFGEFHEAHRWLESAGLGYPGFRREHTRIALLKGEVAGALRLTTDTIRIGEARLKMGGLGWVTTAGHHRHKGIARELIRDTLHYMHEQHYHVSMLFGIPNFYHRFGFVSTLADYVTSLPLRETDGLEDAREARQWREREGKPGDIPAMVRIHNSNDTDTACSVLRSAAHLSNNWRLWKGGRVITDRQGKVIAYFLPEVRENDLHIKDLGVTDPDSCAALLSVCARAARDASVAMMRFAAPPEHPFIRYLMQYRSTHEMKLTRGQGGMMAFVRLEEALESMIPEWESRLQYAAVRDARSEVTLLVDKKPYRIRSGRGAMDIAPGSGRNKLSLSSGELMPLVTGYRYLDDILSRERRILGPDARALLAVMFPKRTPYVWMMDRM
jgi:predicted acetyltransferase